MTLAHLPTLHTMSAECLGLKLVLSYADFASAAYPAANRALLLPFHVVKPITVTKLFCGNGATASGNIDVGIYTADPTPARIVSSGSTAQAGTDTIQEFDITDTVLVPGNYYLAVAKDDTTGTMARATANAGLLRFAGVLQMASAFALPTTITSALVASTFLPLLGLVQGRTLI